MGRWSGGRIVYAICMKKRMPNSPVPEKMSNYCETARYAAQLLFFLVRKFLPALPTVISHVRGLYKQF